MLHSDFAEVVYMRQTAGFVEKSKPDYVCLLLKALYDLKPSLSTLFDKFSNYLIKFGFVCSLKDPSLFVYSEGKYVIMRLLYINDMLLTRNSS